MRRDIPHAVPGAILVAVVVDRLVHFDPRGVDAELEAGALVMIGIDEDPDHVGRSEAVTPLEELLDAVGMGIEGAHEHIKIGRVVRDLRFRLEARRLVLVRAPLPELRYRRRGAPDLIVIFGIDYG